jgi:CheY-like chemotaxis protein
LERLSEHPEIALLLCDLVLTGGIDGVEVARRATAARADLKVIFMSGYSMHLDLPALGSGAVPRLLRKPFHNDELAAQIQTVLDEG